MTLILNGTDNSATTPAVTGTDTDTGVYYPAANQVALATNGTLALIADASQNVGLSKSAPVARLHLAGSGTSGQVTSSFIIENTSSGTMGVDITGSAGSSVARFRYGGGPGTGTNAMTGSFMTAGLEGVSAGTQGIYFAPTQVASADANTLDDYEEGTFTPIFSFTGGAGTLTYSSQFGAYTKIGNMVTCQGLVVVANKGTASGDISLTLPFASAANVYAGAALTWNGITYSAGSYTVTAQNGSGGVLLSFYNEPSGGSKTGLTAAQGNTSFEIIFAITYRV